nr:hypothetical protein CFP56_11944 [Quercus suber]
MQVVDGRNCSALLDNAQTCDHGTNETLANCAALGRIFTNDGTLIHTTPLSILSPSPIDPRWDMRSNPLVNDLKRFCHSPNRTLDESQTLLFTELACSLKFTNLACSRVIRAIDQCQKHLLNKS